MASNDYYVDAGAGADTNGGTSAGSAKANGTAGATDGTATVDLSGDTPDLSSVVVGDCIRISGEAGGIRSTDIFEITAVDDGLDTVDVTPSPGVADPITWAIGGAFATLGKAIGILRTADTDYVWVKGGVSYTETVNIALAMAGTTPATIEGYTSSTGDGGTFTIDGESTRANGITDSIATPAYYIFKNMRVTNHTSHGTSLSMDACVCKNCQFDNNGGIGMSCEDWWRFEECEFYDNTSDGVDTDAEAAFVGCRSYRNGNNGIEARSGVMFSCVAFSNVGHGLIFTGTALLFNVLINCTVDGDNKDTNTALAVGLSYTVMGICINNIAYDCVTGMVSRAGAQELLISRNNLLNNNTDDYLYGAATFTGEVTGAPQFTDEASQDYTLASGSPAKGAGFDESQLEGDSSGMDIGARQRIEAAGGGGPVGVAPNKRGHKQ